MKLLFLAFPFPGQLYGLEKFWAFLKYSKIKNQPIDPKLQEHLSQFKNLEDFRVVVSGYKFERMLHVISTLECSLPASFIGLNELLTKREASISSYKIILTSLFHTETLTDSELLSLRLQS